MDLLDLRKLLETQQTQLAIILGNTTDYEQSELAQVLLDHLISTNKSLIAHIQSNQGKLAQEVLGSETNKSSARGINRSSNITVNHAAIDGAYSLLPNIGSELASASGKEEPTMTSAMIQPQMTSLGATSSMSTPRKGISGFRSVASNTAALMSSGFSSSSTARPATPKATTNMASSYPLYTPAHSASLKTATTSVSRSRTDPTTRSAALNRRLAKAKSSTTPVHSHNSVDDKTPPKTLMESNTVRTTAPLGHPRTSTALKKSIGMFGSIAIKQPLKHSLSSTTISSSNAPPPKRQVSRSTAPTLQLTDGQGAYGAPSSGTQIAQDDAPQVPSLLGSKVIEDYKGKKVWIGASPLSSQFFFEELEQGIKQNNNLGFGQK